MELERSILEFARHLRVAGMPVSPSEVADATLAVRALAGAEVARRTAPGAPTAEQLRLALRACLVKTALDRPLFDKVFALYFQDGARCRAETPPPQARPGKRRAALGRPPLSAPAHPQPAALALTATGAGLGWGAGEGGAAAALLAAILAGNDGRVPGLVAAALAAVVPEKERRRPEPTITPSMTSPTTPAIIPRQVLEAVLLALDWYGVAHRARGSGVPPEKLTRFEQAIRREVEVFLIGTFGDPALRQIAADFDLRQKKLGSLSKAEEELVAEYCRRLGRALAVRRGYRYRPSGLSGRVDLRRTARLAAATGGVPLALRRRHPRPALPELVILADVSGSVRRFSHFFLEACWSLRERYRRTEVFFFVDRLARATDVLAAASVADALEWALTAAPVSVTNNSDYGSAFSQFVRDYLDELFGHGRSATVIILGDARNNWRPSGVESLAEIAAASRAVLWLNPLPSGEWGNRDGLMPDYLPFCRGTWSCGSVAELEKVAAELVKEQVWRV